MAAADAMPIPKKNTAFRYYFTIRKKDSTIVTGWSGPDSERSLDGGTFADCTNEATEIATSSGIGFLDLTATEMNTSCTVIKVSVTNTNAVEHIGFLYPQELDGADILVDTQKINGANVVGDGNATPWDGA